MLDAVALMMQNGKIANCEIRHHNCIRLGMHIHRVTSARHKTMTKAPNLVFKNFFIS